MSCRALRHEPLGIDSIGGEYYALTPRPIDDDPRSPVGWASGLLVWGMGMRPESDADLNKDELPVSKERWNQSDKSVAVKQLAKRIEWRTEKAVGALRPATPNGKSTQTDVAILQPYVINLFESTLKASPAKAPSLSKTRPRVEVVIPISAGKATSNSASSLSSLNLGHIDHGLTRRRVRNRCWL